MNHAAFNFTNTLAAFASGSVIDAGLGFRAPALYGVGLTVIALVVTAIAITTYRQSRGRQVIAVKGVSSDCPPQPYGWRVPAIRRSTQRERLHRLTRDLRNQIKVLVHG